MKKIVFSVVFGALLMFTAPAFAQTSGHSVTLTWGAPSDATPNAIYNIYRANNTCQTPLQTLVQVANVTNNALTYVDPEPVGSYCYYVTHVENGSESVPSNTSSAVIHPNAPSGLISTTK